MSDWGASIVNNVDSFFFNLDGQERVVMGLLVMSLVSLCAAVVLLRKRLRGASQAAGDGAIDLSESGAPVGCDVAATQAELRELIREFSAAASQVLQAVDRNQTPWRLPEAGGAALQLLDLGLTPAEAARATGMTMGEVALLMNLRKTTVSTLHLPATASIEAEEATNETRDGGGQEEGRPLGAYGNGH